MRIKYTWHSTSTVFGVLILIFFIFAEQTLMGGLFIVLDYTSKLIIYFLVKGKVEQVLLKAEAQYNQEFQEIEQQKKMYYLEQDKLTNKLRNAIFGRETPSFLEPKLNLDFRDTEKYLLKLARIPFFLLFLSAVVAWVGIFFGLHKTTPYIRYIIDVPFTISVAAIFLLSVRLLKVKIYAYESMILIAILDAWPMELWVAGVDVKR